VIVIDHGTLPDGRHVYARYAHLEDLQVQAGDTVARGQKIAQVGQFAPGNYHLHFDISTTTRLRDKPADWPGFSLERVEADYTDPKAFIKAHRPPAA
jgi:murein DD-endopeptidase MepM/ murein hydrolase activator NlpD